MPPHAPATHSPAQFMDRLAIRDQALNLLERLIQAVKALDRLPITTENNAKIRDLRDQLIDLLESVDELKPS